MADRTGVVSDDEIGGIDQSPQCSNVDDLPRHHGVGDTGQSGDLGGDRNCRLLEATVDARDIAELTLIIEGEGDGANLDDLVLSVAEPRRFRIEDHGFQRKFRPDRCGDRPRFEFPQDAVAPGPGQMRSHLLLVHAGNRWQSVCQLPGVRRQ